ncbi:response regulator [Sphingobium indicum]|uniref:hypothetical protein n=1 Tax=Sphingobium indicum TaxID=332055 RepID=UPI00030B67CB|nr:hypothetical protein [Sphingobium indicum]NYI23307.1 hypothetical protein [Sphingobium indicum]
MDDTALAAQTVLIVEDDYYLAFDTADALRDAGAGILGPFPTEEKAMDAIRLGGPPPPCWTSIWGTAPPFASPGC